MNKMVEQVKEFHEKFGVPKAVSPADIYEPGVLLMRARLIIEEASEFMEGASRLNAELMADALGDLLYVTIGAAEALDFNIDAIFNEIHASNMSKSLGVKEEDGKIQKGPSYFPPRIRKVMYS